MECSDVMGRPSTDDPIGGGTAPPAAHWPAGFGLALAAGASTAAFLAGGSSSSLLSLLESSAAAAWGLGFATGFGAGLAGAARGVPELSDAGK